LDISPYLSTDPHYPDCYTDPPHKPEKSISGPAWILPPRTATCECEHATTGWGLPPAQGNPNTKFPPLLKLIKLCRLQVNHSKRLSVFLFSSLTGPVPIPLLAFSPNVWDLRSLALILPPHIGFLSRPSKNSCLRRHTIIVSEPPPFPSFLVSASGHPPVLQAWLRIRCLLDSNSGPPDPSAGLSPPKSSADCRSWPPTTVNVPSVNRDSFCR